MEISQSSEVNLVKGKGESKKTSLLSSRSKSRQLRRSQATVIDNDDDNVANNCNSTTVLGADEQKSSAKTGTTKIDVRVTSASDDDVMPTAGRACAVTGVGNVRSGMPATCSPTITLLQKRREATSPLRQTGQRRSPIDGQLLNDPLRSTMTAVGAERRRATKGRSKHSDNRCVSVDSVIAAAVSKLEAISTDRVSCGTSDTRLDVERSSRSATLPDRNTATAQQQQRARAWSPPNASYVQKRYENRPMKIEDYEPGMSSLASRETNLYNFHNPPIEKPGQHCKYVDGSSSLRYRIHKKTRRSSSPCLSDSSLHQQYRHVQKGGDIPVSGLRCPTSPRRVSQSKTATTVAGVSNDLLSSQLDGHHSISSSLGAVTSRRVKDDIKAARKLELELILAQERRKRLEEEAKIDQSRRHSMCFLSPTSPISLDRYNDDVETQRVFLSVPRNRSTHNVVRSKARAIYSFQAQNNRELSLRKGDIVYLLRAVDENWLEGEHHGLVGRFPVSYVEVLVSLEEAAAVNTHHLALVTVLFDFRPRSSYELRLRKGDIVAVVRCLDENWLEGQHDGRQGLFPVSYVELIGSPLATSSPPSTASITPSTGTRLTPTPSVGSSLSCQLHAAGLHATAANNSFSKRSSTNFSTSSDNAEDPNCTSVDVGYVSAVDATNRRAPLSTVVPDYSRQLLDQPPISFIDDVIDTFPVGYRRRSGRSIESRVDRFQTTEVDMRTKTTADHVTRWTLNVDYNIPVSTTCSAPRRWSCNANDVILSSLNHRDQVDPGIIVSTPYCAVQGYSPCDDDELALFPGDIVHVTETFNDGWYIGISQRTRCCGLFPGSYVKKLPQRVPQQQPLRHTNVHT